MGVLQVMAPMAQRMIGMANDAYVIDQTLGAQQEEKLEARWTASSPGCGVCGAHRSIPGNKGSCHAGVRPSGGRSPQIR